MWNDASEAIERAHQANVRVMITAGVNAQTWSRQLELNQRHSSLFATVGIHPQHVADNHGVDDELNQLHDLLRHSDLKHARIVGIGEIGLDAYNEVRKATLARQCEVFVAQLRIAKEFDLPVALHVLAAHPMALEILANEGLPPAGGVLHSCSASAELVREYLALGLHVSFAGTIARPEARRARAACAAVPLERLLIETDSPDQTPVARRPLRNEPAFLHDVLRAAAAIHDPTQTVSLDKSCERLAEASFLNTCRLFRIAEQA